MTSPRIFGAVSFCCVVLVVLTGCNEVKLPPPPPPTLVDATFVASADVNPNDQGQASPIVVHVFELGGLGKFQAADFFSLLESPDATLGADMLNHQELQLIPGGESKVAKKITNNAGYIGVVAGYRDISRVTWRTSFALPSNQTKTVTVVVGRPGLALQ